MYTAAEVARWAKTSPQTARRWIAGYSFSSTSGKRWSPPVTSKRGDDAFLSFEDLVEVAAVAAVRRTGVSMAKIRAAVDYLTSQLGIDRPLLSEKLHTDGRELFLRDEATAPHYTNLTRLGQVAFSYLQEVLREVDYEQEIAIRWWPAGREMGVLVDPRVNFGRPIIATIGVRTETLVDRFVAGLSVEDIADEYRTDPGIIQHAVRFENRSGAVAA